MAQRPTADFNIDPNVTSGTDLANILNRFQDAIDSGNSGGSRPAYLAAGGLWVREGDPMRLYLYDGTTDRELYNTTDGIVGTLEDGTVDGQITTWDESTGAWTPAGAVVVSGGNGGNLLVGTNSGTGKITVHGNGDVPFRWGNTSALGALSYSGTVPFIQSATGPLAFYNGGSESARLDASGRLGIGGEPSRSTKEIEDEAESTLANWKSQLDERLKAEPKADKKAVTQEITGHDKMPTKAELVERLTERNIGGGDAKLQVAGDGYFSGTVDADGFTVNGAPLTRVGDIIETFRTLKNAVSDETTVEGIKEALTNSLGGLIEKFEAMQSAATQEIES